MKWNNIYAAFGSIVWLGLLVLKPTFLQVSLLERLFLFAPLVVVPLSLPLLSTPDRLGSELRVYTVLNGIQPFCAIAAVTSYTFQPGLWSGLFASIWLIIPCLLAGLGFVRLLPRGSRPIEECAIDMGLLFIPVGGIWFIVSRLGMNPMGFHDVIVLLTAIHFHYAGFAALLLIGCIGRLYKAYDQPVPDSYRIGVLGAVIGIPLLAMGITFSPLVELVSAFVLASSMIVVFVLAVPRLLGIIPKWLPKVLLIVTGISILISMFFACVYAYGEYTRTVIFSIPDVARVHGVANAFGLTFCGLLTCRILKPMPSWCWRGVPFSKLSSAGPVGVDYFDRIDAVDQSGISKSGLVDNFDEYERQDFCTREIDQDVRAFYEQTNQFDLIVKPHWSKGFRSGGRLFRWVADAMGQMCLPVKTIGSAELVHSKIMKLRDEVDGRANVRAWVRTYAETNKPVYIAAYANHQYGDQTYMNIAFPVPGGSITSILKLNDISATKGALILTSLLEGEGGDQGVYFANRFLPIRLPLNETIRVWSATSMEHPVQVPDNEKGITLVAQHDMWIWGIKFLTLDYYIRRNSECV